MQRFFSVFVIFAIIAIGGGYLYSQRSEAEAKAQVVDALAQARRSFADKARSAVDEEDADYARAIQTALRSYDDELKKQVYGKHPQWRDPGRYEKEITEKFKKGELQESQHKNMMEGYKLVRDAYDVLMAGNWKPVLTHKGAGDTRLDIYELRRGKDEEGNPILEGKFFFWGIEDSTRVTWGQLGARIWHTEMEKVKEGRKMVEKEVEKVLGRAEGDATPRIIIQTPNKYVDEFPSFVSPGVIWLPVLPREAQFLDLEYSYALKKGGSSFDALLKWEKLTAPEKWKLGEGESWDAEVIEATAEEIAGKDEEEEKKKAEEEEQNK